MWVYCMHKRTGSRHVSRHTHTHTADETFTALIPKYYQDFQLLSLTPSLTSLPVSPSTPPLLHLMCLKKETAHSILQRDWERNIYKNISPAARIDLADLLGSRPPSFHLLLCRSLQLCPQTRTNNLPAILDPQFFFFFLFFCTSTHTVLSRVSKPALHLLSGALFHSPKQLSKPGSLGKHTAVGNSLEDVNMVLTPLCEMQPIIDFHFTSSVS